jgi:pyruvate/2-oxoglutarate dehydrogenase complex dihydrolipoamide acyltransferase (E2) component
MGSTFTITSLGALGGVMATAIINPPEVAILGVHRIAKRPAVVGDQIVIRDLMNLSLSFDHRVIDGFDAAQFVAEIKRSLEAPAALAEGA